jgi:carbon storage regulator CsrA
MLVLSRKLNEKILFPGLRASVQVVAIKGGKVSLGIDAPPEVKVLREEIPDRRANWGEPAREGTGWTEQSSRCLQLACMKLGLARLQLRSGWTPDVETALAKIHEDLQGLRRHLEDACDNNSPLTAAARQSPAARHNTITAPLGGALAKRDRSLIL